jgi:hypothetical protein
MSQCVLRHFYTHVLQARSISVICFATENRNYWSILYVRLVLQYCNAAILQQCNNKALWINCTVQWWNVRSWISNFKRLFCPKALAFLTYTHTTVLKTENTVGGPKNEPSIRLQLLMTAVRTVINSTLWVFGRGGEWPLNKEKMGYQPKNIFFSSCIAPRAQTIATLCGLHFYGSGWATCIVL